MKHPPRRLMPLRHAEQPGHECRWYLVTIERDKRKDLGHLYIQGCCYPTVTGSVVDILHHQDPPYPVTLSRSGTVRTFYRKRGGRRWVQIAQIAFPAKPPLISKKLRAEIEAAEIAGLPPPPLPKPKKEYGWLVIERVYEPPSQTPTFTLLPPEGAGKRAQSPFLRKVEQKNKLEKKQRREKAAAKAAATPLTQPKRGARTRKNRTNVTAPPRRP